MKRTMFSAILATLALVLSLTACDDFFSSGWGNPREYSAGNINLTVNNIDRWFDRSIGNPPLATRINDAILLRLEDGSLSGEERRLFQRYGVRIAVSSSNMGVIILTNAIDILADMADLDNLSDEEMEEMLLDILGSIQSDFRNSGGAAAADNIASMIRDDISTLGDVPTFSGDSFVHDATPSEVAMAILVLTLAIVEESDYADDISNWEDFDLEALDVGLDVNDEGQVIVTGSDPDSNILALAAYLNLIKNDTEGRFDGNFLTDAIRDAFARAEN